MTQEKAKRLMLQLLSRLIDESLEAKEVLNEKKIGSDDVEKAIYRVGETANYLEDLLYLAKRGRKDA